MTLTDNTHRALTTAQIPSHLEPQLKWRNAISILGFMNCSRGSLSVSINEYKSQPIFVAINLNSTNFLGCGTLSSDDAE